VRLDLLLMLLVVLPFFGIEKPPRDVFQTI
jgi:hypothetical protein